MIGPLDDDIGNVLPYPIGAPNKSWTVSEIKAFLEEKKKKKTGKKEIILQIAQVVYSRMHDSEYNIADLSHIKQIEEKLHSCGGAHS